MKSKLLLSVLLIGNLQNVWGSEEGEISETSSVIPKRPPLIDPATRALIELQEATKSIFQPRTWIQHLEVFFNYKKGYSEFENQRKIYLTILLKHIKDPNKDTKPQYLNDAKNAHDVFLTYLKNNEEHLKIGFERQNVPFNFTKLRLTPFNK